MIIKSVAEPQKLIITLKAYGFANLQHYIVLDYVRNSYSLHNYASDK